MWLHLTAYLQPFQQTQRERESVNQPITFCLMKQKRDEKCKCSGDYVHVMFSVSGGHVNRGLCHRQRLRESFLSRDAARSSFPEKTQRALRNILLACSTLTLISSKLPSAVLLRISGYTRYPLHHIGRYPNGLVHVAVNGSL